MNLPNNWTIEEQINFLQRRIIIWSIIYYELDANIVSDRKFDSIAKQLVKMQSEHNDVMNTQYGYCMYDFDGTTGFDLYHRLNDSDKERLMKYAFHELKLNRKVKKK